MSKVLLQQLRKQREVKVQLTDKLSVTAQRPTDLQMTQLRIDGKFGDLGQKYVIGWEGFLENDIVGGGGTDRVAFDQELWADWYADHPEFWEKIAMAVVDSYNAHAKVTEEAAKNSQPG